MAAQLILMNASPLRLECSCRARATSSFAGATLAGDQHGRRRVGDLVDQAEALPQRARGANQSEASEVARQVAAAGIAALGFLIELEARQRFAHHLQDVVLIGALLDGSKAPCFTASTDSVMRP